MTSKLDELLKMYKEDYLNEKGKHALIEELRNDLNI